MERPTLEEVKAHFKDAVIVECVVDKHHYKIDKSYEIEYEIGGYWSYICKLWNCSQGYAKIIK